MKLILATSISALLLLPACVQHYQRAPLSSDSFTTAQSLTKHQITVNAQHMSRTQIHNTFGTRGRKLGYYSLCPIQLSIKNESPNTLIFDPANTSIEYACHEHVAYCLQNHTVRNTACLIGLGLAATSIICLHTLPFALWFYVTGIGTTSLYVGLSTATGMLILTPTVAVYYAKNSHTQNERIAHDITQIAATQAQMIEPGHKLDVILFTKKENCKKDFTITLINKATQEPTIINVNH
jgi:hypothetical protein